MPRMRRWLAVAAVVVPAVVALTGCKYGAYTFRCSGSNQCGGAGICQPDNLCSFPDGACPSGQRYGDIAGDKSGQCVGEQIMVDAGIDAPPDAPRTCFGTNLLNNFNVCLQSPPMTPRMITATTPLNTDDTNMCTPVMSGGNGLCVVAATTIMVDATWRATGGKPLVLIARDSITITTNGVIDVASRRGAPQEIGAGGDPVSCQNGTGPANANSTNGGGAGGSFAGLGGKGGNGGGNGENVLSRHHG